jgi:hypothetical protein
MAVREHSSAGLAIAPRNPQLAESFRAALGDLRDAGVIGGAYRVAPTKSSRGSASVRVGSGARSAVGVRRRAVRALPQAGATIGTGSCASSRARAVLAGVRARRSDAQRRLVLVNLAAVESHARGRPPWSDLGRRTWHLRDALSERAYVRDGWQLQDDGLFVDMQPWEPSLPAFEQ